MKSVPVSQSDVDEMVETVRSMLTTALSEERSIEFVVDRPTYEMPSSGPMAQYALTGRTTITIEIGREGSK